MTLMGAIANDWDASSEKPDVENESALIWAHVVPEINASYSVRFDHSRRILSRMTLLEVIETPPYPKITNDTFTALLSRTPALKLRILPVNQPRELSYMW